MTAPKKSENELDRAMAEALEAVEQRERGDTDPAESAAEQAPAASDVVNDEQVAALKDQLLRLAADFENFRKRTRREAEQAQRNGLERLALDLLPALDNLSRALQHMDDDASPLAEGVRMVVRQFGDALRAHDIVPFESVGAVFDPQWHEAMSQVATTEHAPGTVAAEVSRGYRSGDRLLRPAQVVVAMARTKPATENNAAATSK